MNKDNIKALILAAGRGSRMDHITANQPKCFSKLGSKRLIDWQLESLQANGIKDIAIVTGYLSEKFDEYSVKKINNLEWNSSNMIVSLLKASTYINDSTIISYSDIVYHPNVVEILKHANYDIVLAYDKNWYKQWQKRFDDPRIDAETFKITKEGIITEIGSKANTLEEIQGQYLGLFKLTPNGIAIIEDIVEEYFDRRDTLDMTEVFQLIINKGINIYGVDVDSTWFEIDSPSDLILAQKLYNSGELDISL
jgi:choline kinase